MKTLTTALIILFALNVQAQKVNNKMIHSVTISGENVYDFDKNLKEFMELPGVKIIKLERDYDTVIATYQVTKDHKEHIYRQKDNSGSMCAICGKPEIKSIVAK